MINSLRSILFPIYLRKYSASATMRPWSVSHTAASPGLGLRQGTASIKRGTTAAGTASAGRSQGWLTETAFQADRFREERKRSAPTCTWGSGECWRLNLESLMWALGWGSSRALLRNLVGFYTSRHTRGPSQSFRAGVGKRTRQVIPVPDDQWHGGNIDESVECIWGKGLVSQGLHHLLQTPNTAALESTYLPRIGGVRKQPDAG